MLLIITLDRLSKIIPPKLLGKFLYGIGPSITNFPGTSVIQAYVLSFMPIISISLPWITFPALFVTDLSQTKQCGPGADSQSGSFGKGHRGLIPGYHYSVFCPGAGIETASAAQMLPSAMNHPAMTITIIIWVYITPIRGCAGAQRREPRGALRGIVLVSTLFFRWRIKSGRFSSIAPPSGAARLERAINMSVW